MKEGKDGGMSTMPFSVCSLMLINVLPLAPSLLPSLPPSLLLGILSARASVCRSLRPPGPACPPPQGRGLQ